MEKLITLLVKLYAKKHNVKHIQWTCGKYIVAITQIEDV